MYAMAKTTKSEQAKAAWAHVEDWKISTVLADLPHAVDIGLRGSKKGLRVKIWSGEDHVGTLDIYKGGVQWSHRNKKYHQLSWRQFAVRMME